MHPIQRLVARAYFTASGLIAILRGEGAVKRTWPPYVLVDEAYPRQELHDLVAPQVALNAQVGDVLETRHGPFKVTCRKWDQRGRLILIVTSIHPCC